MNGMRNIIDACQARGVRRLIYVSRLDVPLFGSVRLWAWVGAVNLADPLGAKFQQATLKIWRVFHRQFTAMATTDFVPIR